MQQIAVWEGRDIFPHTRTRTTWLIVGHFRARVAGGAEGPPPRTQTGVAARVRARGFHDRQLTSHMRPRCCLGVEARLISELHGPSKRLQGRHAPPPLKNAS
ncbi:hypothetical protein E2C01_044706 [Portunus trituberculatus]|uniref:Uncharacterized protein n=1 Tax=Portunus trituberculatus TaxID=210409 RepID=A0A5B7FTU0_PORTR|nr:hypothetical protein [Portunus trituberculatus]